MRLRFISDLHIYDPSQFSWRPQFRDFEKVCNFMEQSWNSIVDEDDIVVVAGDVGDYNKRTIEFLKSLHGQKILVLGNHDRDWLINMYECDVFKGVFETLDYQGVIVSHIPDPRFDVPGKYFIHGHHHMYNAPGMYSAYKEFASHPLRLNCSADIVKFKPRTLNELIISKQILIDNMEEVYKQC